MSLLAVAVAGLISRLSMLRASPMKAQLHTFGSYSWPDSWR